MGGFPRRQLVITGEKRSIEIKPMERYLPASSDLYATVTDYRITDWNHCGSVQSSDPQDRYDSMTAAFAAMVRGELENPRSYEYELRLYRMVLAACGVDIDYKADITL